KSQTMSASKSNQITYYGIALKNKTSVYKTQSKNGDILRSYDQGSRLKFKSLNTNWYEATVMYNGKWTKGYIHKDDVETISDIQHTLNGVALKSPTKVYV